MEEIVSITEHWLSENGYKTLDSLSLFKITFSSFADNKAEKTKIKNRGFILERTESKGRDFEIEVCTFRKKTEAEINKDNIDWHVKNLESRFNIKITYTRTNG